MVVSPAAGIPAVACARSKVGSIPRGGHCQSDHVLRATREGRAERESPAHVATDLIDAPIAQAELRERGQRPDRDVAEEIRAGERRDDPRARRTTALLPDRLRGGHRGGDRERSHRAPCDGHLSQS